MNDDALKNLERELSRLVPAELPEALKDRLANEPAEEPLTVADRVLAIFCGSGAIAAAVVVLAAIIVANGPTPPRISPSDAALHRQMTMEYQRLIAMR